MELTTNFSMRPDWDDDEKQREVDELLNTIRSFAKMDNFAFWDAKSADDEKCIVVYGFLGDLDSGAYINSDDIEETVSAWCNDLADWCEGDEDGDLRVELSDIEDRGGLHIECFDSEDEKDHELYILPIRKH